MRSGLVSFQTLRAGDDWHRWQDLSLQAPPHLAPEFFALTRAFVDRGETVVAGAWDGAAMIGALPLVLEQRVLRALRSDHSPGYDACGGREGITAMWNALRDDPRWSELVIDKVPRDSLLVAVLPELARRDDRPVIVRPDSTHLVFALPGFEARLKPKFRANLQRCARKARDLVFERILVPTREDLDEAAAIEAMAWKGAGGTSIATDAKAVHFYAVLTRLFGRRGKASLAFLRANGKRIAMLFAVEDAHTLYALKIGYDPQYANISPGHLIVRMVAEDAEQRGLRELDFVGRDDEWKRKWTDDVRERVAIVIYQRDARGLVRYALRELVKPRLPQTWRDTPRSPLPRRCQRADVLGDHSLAARIVDRARSGFGIRSSLKRRRGPAPARLGVASRYAAGTWVRVRDAAAIRATLDDRERTRGLAFVPAQWLACGRVFRVASQVRRLRDDHGRFRAVAKTVVLDGVDCGFAGDAHAGCGRHCPLLFRDDWLEPAEPPHAGPPPADVRRHARVRELAEIAAGLDLFGRRDGVTFMPEMAAYAGKRLAIAGKLGDVFELDRWVAPRAVVYLLDGAHCSGAVSGDRGPCDRACTLMWHEDWLVLEDAR